MSRVLLLLVSLALISCAASEGGEMPLPDAVAFPLRVRAEIDGRSELRMQGGFIWWHQFEFEPPGMWGDDQPTFLNGEAWWPMWPSDENAFCNCDSVKDELLSPPLKSDGSEISVQVLEARGSVTVVEQPSAENAFTASIEFNDPEPDRDWFEVIISQN